MSSNGDEENKFSMRANSANTSMEFLDGAASQKLPGAVSEIARSTRVPEGEKLPKVSSNKEEFDISTEKGITYKTFGEVGKLISWGLK